jgi:hypothetical protein
MRPTAADEANYLAAGATFLNGTPIPPAQRWLETQPLAVSTRRAYRGSAIIRAKSNA